jgi:hypothetical protein
VACLRIAKRRWVRQLAFDPLPKAGAVEPLSRARDDGCDLDSWSSALAQQQVSLIGKAFDQISNLVELVAGRSRVQRLDLGVKLIVARALGG